MVSVRLPTGVLQSLFYFFIILFSTFTLTSFVVEEVVVENFAATLSVQSNSIVFHL